MAVLYIRINSGYKKALEIEAQKLGMPITTYCRMVLIKSVNGEK